MNETFWPQSEASKGQLTQIARDYCIQSEIKSFVQNLERSSVTRLGDFLDFGPLLKPSATIDLPKFSHILRQFF